MAFDGGAAKASAAAGARQARRKSMAFDGGAGKASATAAARQARRKSMAFDGDRKQTRRKSMAFDEKAAAAADASAAAVAAAVAVAAAAKLENEAAAKRIAELSAALERSGIDSVRLDAPLSEPAAMADFAASIGEKITAAAEIMVSQNEALTALSAKLREQW